MALDDLLWRTGQGDSSAFAQLYQRTSARLFGLCVRMLRDRAEAEEALQEIFVVVWRRARDFDPARAGPLTWLIAITRNKAIDRLRRRPAPGPLPRIELEQLADERQGPAADAEASQDYRRLHECLDTLDPKQRGALREAFFSGTTYEELARRCDVPLGTMKSRIRRGLAQLRTCLES